MGEVNQDPTDDVDVVKTKDFYIRTRWRLIRAACWRLKDPVVLVVKFLTQANF
jgi:hypothetical protein